MANGVLTNGYFPDANGIPLNNSSMLGKQQGKPHDISVTLERTFGTGAAIIGEVLTRNASGAQWIPVSSLSKSGNGAAVRGTMHARVIAEAFRLNVAIGSSPGTGGSAPYAVVNAYPANNNGLESRATL